MTASAAPIIARTRAPLLLATTLLATTLLACAPSRPGADTADAAELGGSEWRLVMLDGGMAVSADSSRRPSLSFSSDSMLVTGNGGCNRFSGGYSQTDSSLQVGPLLSTKMACAEDAMNMQEREYLTALESTDHFRVTADTLVLLSASSELARLVR